MDTTNEVKEKDCKTCLHHEEGSTLNEVKPVCWDCTSFKSKVHWEPKEEDTNKAVQAKPLEPLEYAKLHQAPDPVTPSDYLEIVKHLISQRGEERDKPQGERSMAQAVDIFRAMTGVNLTEAQGWQFMIALKFSRMAAGKFKLDDYLDAIGYTALLTETVVNENS